MKIRNCIIGFAATALLAACTNERDEYQATGTFESTEVLVSAEATGKLLSFEVYEGQSLQAGQEVGCIDTVQLYLKIMQLEASNSSVRSRRSDVNRQIAALEQQIATQEREKARFENLLRGNAANQKQVDDLAAQIALLRKQVAAQRETLENSNRSITEESSSIRIQVAQLEDQLRKCRITAPMRGTVLAKYAEPGEWAVQGKALFKMADLEHMFLRAYLTSEQLASVKLGQKVNLLADYGGDSLRTYSGTIAWISGEAEFTPKGILTDEERANQVYAVKIAVKNDGFLKIGMYGRVQLVPEK